MDQEERVSREGEVLKDKYELAERLGSGAMGEVYRARNLLVDRTVAIKILHPELGRDPNVVARFLREAKAANVVRHRNIVDVLDVDSDGRGLSFIVQEFLEGVDLAAHIAERGGRLEPDEALELLLPVADALGAAHARGLVHRDLKPENILLAVVDGEIVPKVLDFGISKIQLPGVADGRPVAGWSAAASAKLTAFAGAMGTPAYMSPEQIKDSGSVDARADVWALGVVLYEALAGELPFDAETLPELFAMICSQEPVPLARRRPEIGRELTRVVHRALDANRGLRFADGAALAHALRAARDQRRSGRPHASPAEPLAPSPLHAGQTPVPLSDPHGWELAVPATSRRPMTPIPPPSGVPRAAVMAPGAVSIPPGESVDDSLLDWDEVIGVPPALELEEEPAQRPHPSPIPAAVGLGPASLRPPRSPAPEVPSSVRTAARSAGAPAPRVASSAPPRSQRAVTGAPARSVARPGSILRLVLTCLSAAALALGAPRLSPAGMAWATELLRGWAALPFAAALVPGLVATAWLFVRAGRGPSAPLLLAGLGLGVATGASATIGLALAAPGLVGHTARAVALLSAPWAVMAALGGLALHAWLWSRDLVVESGGHSGMRWVLRVSAVGAVGLTGWVALAPRPTLEQIAATTVSPAERGAAQALGKVGVVTLGAGRLARAHRLARPSPSDAPTAPDQPASSP